MNGHGDGGRLEPSPDLSWRDVNGELVIVDTRRGDYHVLNALGARVFAAIVEGDDTASIASSIAETHDMTPREVQRDVDAFVATLAAKGLLTRR